MYIEEKRPSVERLILMVDASDDRLAFICEKATTHSQVSVQRAALSVTPSHAADRVAAWVVQVEDAEKLCCESLFSALAPPIIAVVGGAEGLALETLRRGAWDVLPYPPSPARLGSLLQQAILAGRKRASDRQLVADYFSCAKQLTNPEHDVLEAIVQGKLNKQIAKEMDISIRTVEQRRSKIFCKMKVASAVPLARRVAQVETLQRLCN